MSQSRDASSLATFCLREFDDTRETAAAIASNWQWQRFWNLMFLNK